MVPAFTRTVCFGLCRPAWTRRGFYVYGRIKWHPTRYLSITGVEGPLRGGNARGGCGQIFMEYTGHDPRFPASAKITRWAPGWNATMFQRFLDIWERWHLSTSVPDDALRFLADLPLGGRTPAWA